MAKTPSQMPPLGMAAPDFKLLNPSTDRLVQLSDFSKSSALLVMFICNHCPFVKHIRPGLASLGRDYQSKDISIVAINSNDVANYPDDSPAMMVTEVMTAGYRFPYLYDETQQVAKAYQAVCTPDFFLFDAQRKLVYRGQLDDSRPGNDIPVTGKDLRAAIDALLAGAPISSQQVPSIGCNIKWKAGNAPNNYTV